MTYRERVIRAIQHEQTEITPWAFEITSEFSDVYQSQHPCESVEADLETHIMFGKYKSVKWLESDLYEDAFGVQWRIGSDGGDIGIPVNAVVSPDNIEDYRFPDVDHQQLNQAIQTMKDDTEHFRIFRATYTLYERSWSLMGMENLLMNMILEEKATMRLFERVAEYTLNILDRILDEDFEAVYFGDDWGKQQGMIMGPRYWRKFIKPFIAQLVDTVKSRGKLVILHSCGDVEEIFPDLIRMGVDVYNTVQPEIYDLMKIKKEYGKDLSFWGAISTQQFLTERSPQAVYDKSIQTIRTLGDGGGYIFSPTHAVTPDIPVENVTAMLRAVKSARW